MKPTPELVESAFRKAANALQSHPHLDFRTAVRRVLGTGEWRSDEGRISAAEAKRQRRMERNQRNLKPKEVTKHG